MKKYILTIGAAILFGLSACYDDDSKIATEENMLPAITIDGLPSDTTMTAYTLLELMPEVSGYADGELTYTWYIYGGEFEKQTQEGYRTVKLAEGKKLSSELPLRQGTYTLVFEATNKASGLTAVEEVRLRISTPFSEGFYILKETAEGNTELDVYNLSDKTVISNVLEATQGSSLSGRPRGLNIVYSKAYVDPETAVPGNTTMAFVAHGENEFSGYRTEDLAKIFDRSTLLFGDMDEDEIPYLMCSCGSSNIFLSNKGIRSESTFSANEYGTGKLGVFNDDQGGSGFVQYGGMFGTPYWNAQSHNFMSFDGDGAMEIPYYEEEVDFEGMQPIATGFDGQGAWFVMENGDGKRYLAFPDVMLGKTTVRSLSKVSHVGNASVIAGCNTGDPYMYAVDGNKIYRYDIEADDEEEEPVKAEELPGEGTISYVANIFMQNWIASFQFDYFVVGLQNGGNYSLYLYELLGGLPLGSPVYKIENQPGILKDVRFVSGDELMWPNLSGYDFPL